MANAVNQVWNYCNNAQKHALRHNQKWPSAFDLNSLVDGSSKMMGLHAHSIRAVCQRYVVNRQSTCRAVLRYRGRKALGWVPFTFGAVARGDGGFVYLKRKFKCWVHRELPAGATIRCGCFAEDSCGNWYINVTIEMPDATAPIGDGYVGIDLGLKDVAVLSNGEKFENPRHTARVATKLAMAQRARKRRCVARAHRKVARSRADYLHKVSRKIVNSVNTIFIGDVSSSRLAMSKMATAVFDVGWCSFRHMLSYKAMGRGGMAICVDEHGTSRTCSQCGDTERGPKGIAGIGIRQWTCSGCGAVHDRDVNAARNIARRGLATLDAGAPRNSGQGSSHRATPS